MPADLRKGSVELICRPGCILACLAELGLAVAQNLLITIKNKNRILIFLIPTG